MYIVRETFTAKPGHAGELAQMMKKEMASWEGFKGHVLLDMVTDYNQIVVEYEINSLSDFEKMMMKEKEAQKKKSGDGKTTPPKYTELYQTGKREIFRIV